MKPPAPKVLIVDDQPANLFALQQMLSKIKVEVIQASNGNDALSYALEHELALILLDVQMPEMDGYEVATLLRSNDDTSKIPIIFVTAAYKDDAHKILGYGSGAVDYLEKPIDDNILLSKMRVFIDLYQQKRELERTLDLMESTNTQLVLEISERKATEKALKEAKLVAESANYAKSAFLANMSHELRTPLNAILGYAQILQQEGALSDTQQQGVKTILRSGEYLLTLINDILDLAKVEAGQLELFPNSFNLERFFIELSDIFRIKTAKKGLEFRFESKNALPIEIHADEKRLRQVCMNLLSNAVKFTEQGEVRFTVEYQKPQLIIQVFDTGIGIPQEMHSKIFQPFVQTGANKYKQQGTGLGLAISRNLIDRMGGQIALETDIVQGSCFTFQVPVQETKTVSVSQTMDDVTSVIGVRRSDGTDTQIHLLVVDDVIENRAVLRGLLEPLGFIITEASNGTEAVACTNSQNFDAILMDLVMPEMDGLTATKKILNNSDNSERVIIAITASAFEEDRQTSIAAGCSDYVTKPFELSKLLQTLQKHLPITWDYADTSCKESEKTEITKLELEDNHKKILLSMIEHGSMHEIIKYLENLLDKNYSPTQVKTLLSLAKNFKLANIRRILEN